MADPAPPIIHCQYILPYHIPQQVILDSVQDFDKGDLQGFTAMEDASMMSRPKWGCRRMDLVRTILGYRGVISVRRGGSVEGYGDGVGDVAGSPDCWNE